MKAELLKLCESKSKKFLFKSKRFLFPVEPCWNAAANKVFVWRWRRWCGWCHQRPTTCATHSWEGASTDLILRIYKSFKTMLKISRYKILLCSFLPGLNTSSICWKAGFPSIAGRLRLSRRVGWGPKKCHHYSLWQPHCWGRELAQTETNGLGLKCCRKVKEGAPSRGVPVEQEALDKDSLQPYAH